jgi:GNAT superfamily N-acetyltransferase
MTYFNSQCFAAVNNDAIVAVCMAVPPVRSSCRSTGNRKRGIFQVCGNLAGVYRYLLQMQSVLLSAPSDVRARFDAIHSVATKCKVGTRRCWCIDLSQRRSDLEHGDIARRLLSHIIELADRDHADVVANADGKRILALYQENGFTIEKEVAIPDGPTMYIVRRPVQ